MIAEPGGGLKTSGRLESTRGLQTFRRLGARNHTTLVGLNRIGESSTYSAVLPVGIHDCSGTIRLQRRATWLLLRGGVLLRCSVLLTRGVLLLTWLQRWRIWLQRGDV